MELDIQAMVNKVAQALVIEFPEIAENDPMWIGATAKKFVMDGLTWMTTK